MRIQTIIIFVYLMLTQVIALCQELPANFHETIEQEYNSISPEERDLELNMSFDEYFQMRSDQYINEQLYLISLFNNRSANDLCDNGTFESGTINTGDWSFSWGDQNNSGTTKKSTGHFDGSYQYSASAQVHHQVQSSGPDNYATILNKVWTFPAGNSNSLRIGNAHNNQGYESVAKFITITPSNAMMNFSYAVVMNDPHSHSVNVKPSFEVQIIEFVGGLIPFIFHPLVNLGGGSNKISSNDPLLKNSGESLHGSPVLYKDWECVQTDLSSLMGKRVLIRFVTKDCGWGNHMGYGYIDNFCIPCDDAPSKSGTIKLNPSRTDTCGIPGKICIDYVLPNTSSPSVQFDLNLFQNNGFVSTISSPILYAGSTYCFNLNSTNIAGLNLALPGFDYRIKAVFKDGSFQFPNKFIGQLNSGIIPDINNDYQLDCFNCCQTPLDLKYTKDNHVANVPNGAGWSQNIPLSITEELWTIRQSSIIPITELSVNIQDFEFKNDIEACANCINNPGHWASMSYRSSQWQNIGSGTGQLNPITGGGTILGDRKNLRELVWNNPAGVLLNSGDQFSFNLIFPPFSEIPCCVTSVEVCYKVSWKDANCYVCETINCVEYDLVNK